MLPGVPGLKRALILLFLVASLTLPSCGGYNSNSTSPGTNLTNRAFFSENVSAGTIGAGVYIVDAQNDVRAAIAPISAGNTPGMMVLTPNRTQTLVFSAAGNQLTVITNATESATGQVTLPGFTESLVVSPDSSTAYAAVPTAMVVGQSPGVVKVISLRSAAFTGEVDVPAARYLSIDNSGNRILAFSDNADSVAVITPSNIGIGTAVTSVGGFDRPVAAFFSSDDTIAYVLNCGAECGGTQASIQQLNLTDNTLGKSVPVCAPGPNPQQCAGPAAGSVALVNGSTMYVAGTPYSGGLPSQPCIPQTTAAPSCGLLTIVDLNSMTVTSSGTIITDGYHNRMALGANGQLFIGARTCTEITAVNPGDEVRGCLSIYNTQNAKVGSIQPNAVTIPPANGEVTGIQPIAKRTVVYVVQNGALGIYDTTTDALEHNARDPNHPGQIFNLVGQFVDVKTPDF
jgi:hypothetical protein